MPTVWLPLEANPEVMNSFLRKMGVPAGWEINDVFGLEEELLGMLPRPVLALLLLFPITPKYVEFAKKQFEEATGKSVSDSLFYMKQTISNACGTVALLHAVANNRERIGLEDGALKTFLDMSQSMSPEERAQALQDQTGSEICRGHEDAAQEGQTAAPSREDNVEYHFVAFVQVEGQLYELDGRKPGPQVIGPSSEDTFLKDAAAACQGFMSCDPDNINFTILALTAAAAS